MPIEISVVVPTYKRPQLLRRCLNALLLQNFDNERFEIIVADDSASLHTAKLIAELNAKKSRPLMRYVAVTGNHGPAAARNRGWQESQGQIIAFTDDDCEPDKDWLKNGYAAFDQDTAAVQGRIVMPIPPLPTDYELDASGLEKSEFVTANCFCRHTALEAVSGFDEQFRFAWREDSDLFFKLLKTNAKIKRAENTIVIHPVRPARWGISLAQQRKIIFDALLYKKHPELYKKKIRSTPPWHYYLIVISMQIAVLSLLFRAYHIALISFLIWLGFTAWFCMKRLRGTIHTFKHIAEMIVTSILIPPVAVFWRLAGAWRFKTKFI